MKMMNLHVKGSFKKSQIFIAFILSAVKVFSHTLFGRRGGGRKTQASGKYPPRVVENSTQAFGKSHPGFWKTTKFAQTVRLYFPRSASFRRKIEKITTLCQAKLNPLYVRAKKQTIDLLKLSEVC